MLRETSPYCKVLPVFQHGKYGKILCFSQHNGMNKIIHNLEDDQKTTATSKMA